MPSSSRPSDEWVTSVLMSTLLAVESGFADRLAPHAISVNELDLLRDEGPACHRRLVEAGVEALVQASGSDQLSGVPGPDTVQLARMSMACLDGESGAVV